MLTLVRPTPLRDRHVALGGRMIEFAGWEMPVQYSGIVEEHRRVRSSVGLFDLSHMGELFVEGPDASAFLNYAIVSYPGGLAVGRAQYSMICAPDGGVLDDLIVYRLADTRFMIVANASNTSVVVEALRERIGGFAASLENATERFALVAIQGPRAVDVFAALTTVDLRALRYYAIAEGTVGGVDALVARTGYTGEDGFEVFVDASNACRIWDEIQHAGEPFGILPVGLGARDTLRLEAGMPLYGNELDSTTTPYHAGLGRVVKLEKPGDFVGRAALEQVNAIGCDRTLVGLVVRGRGIARHGYPLFAADKTGVVTSGTLSPTLGVAIAMGYVGVEATGSPDLTVEIRDQRVPVEIVPLPFYKRAR